MRTIARILGGSSSESDTKPLKCAVEDRSVDECRPLRVVVIGSGISGILASIRFRQRIPNLDLQVYEKNADIGGTWLENRYPGCACGEYLVSSDRTTSDMLTPSRYPCSHVPGDI